MTQGFSAKQHLTRFFQSMTDNNFPKQVQVDTKISDADGAARWLSCEQEKLLDMLGQHGAVLLRGLPLSNALDFDACVIALKLKNFTYKESLSNAVRINKTERVFTANEAPSEVEIFLHHEMAQTPNYPSKLVFFCEHPSDTGGSTPLCQSNHLLKRLQDNIPQLIDELESKGVRYTNVMPASADLASGQGRSWQNTLGSICKASAETRLQQLNYTWEWLKDDNLKVTTPVLPATRMIGDGRKVFFNQLIAAYRGWKDSRNQGSKKIQFGDGSEISEELMDTVCELAENITHDHFWAKGDLLLVDNFLVMHGRRPFVGTRKVLASLAS